jgi:hypothetical protein
MFSRKCGVPDTAAGGLSRNRGGKSRSKKSSGAFAPELFTRCCFVLDHCAQIATAAIVIEKALVVPLAMLSPETVHVSTALG